MAKKKPKEEESDSCKEIESENKSQEILPKEKIETNDIQNHSKFDKFKRGVKLNGD